MGYGISQRDFIETDISYANGTFGIGHSSCWKICKNTKETRRVKKGTIMEFTFDMFMSCEIYLFIGAMCWAWWFDNVRYKYG